MDTPAQYNNGPGAVIDATTDKTTINGKSFLFDYKTGEFVMKNGKPVEVEGIEALKVWIEKTLRTVKNKYDIYENINYGVEDMQKLMSSSYPYALKKSEIERYIKEALLINPEIKAVDNFEFTREKRKIIVNFRVTSIYGVDEMQEVII